MTSKPKSITCNGKEYVHPLFITHWIDDMRQWPSVTMKHITDYLLHSKACDGLENGVHKSMEAYDMVNSGWVGSVSHALVENDFIFLCGSVRPSQSISKCDYEAYACVKADGTVANGHCSCMSGLGHGCSHVAAILFKVYLAWKEGLCAMSSTDQKCTWSKSWNGGSKRNIEPGTLGNMDFKSTKLEYPEEPTKNRAPFALVQFHDHEELVSVTKTDNAMNIMSNISGSIFSDMLNVKVDTNKSGPSALGLPVLSHDSHCLDYVTNTRPTCAICSSFYDRFINVSQEKRKELADITTNQSSGNFAHIWTDCRRLRISSSVASKIPKRESTDPSKFIERHLFNKFSGNAATQHGINSEPLARADYEVQYGPVVQTGTVVNGDVPWLSASPDGLVGDSKILEIKCPLTDIQELLSDRRYDVHYDDSGIIKLNPTGKNGYYTQIQIAKACCERDNCDLVIWQKPNMNDDISSIVVNVGRNNDFIQKLIVQLRKFYFVNLLPKIVDHFHSGVLGLSQDFLKLFPVSEL